MTDKIEELYQSLIKQYGGFSVKKDELLSKYTTFKIGGKAKLFITAKNTEQLIDIISKARKLKVNYFLLGGGSNILVSDKGFDGLVVKNLTDRLNIKSFGGRYKKNASQKEVYLEVDSGVNLNRLVRFTLNEKLSGLEAFLGLPGTVGGAVFMNSHNMKMKDYFGDHLVSAKILNSENLVKTVLKSYFKFDYDRSIIQKTKEIVLSAILKLSTGNKDDIWRKAEEALNQRKKTQPNGTGSAGCIFRNISKAECLRIGTPNATTSSGYLIEAVGMKGVSVGNAQVSDIHANFIINKGNAQAKDIVKLINIIKDKVSRRFKVNLQEEIIKVGG